jgi:glutamyl-tRNA synthetase
VVDDLDMNITDVIRGDDHVNNTPRQVNIFRALGAELPRFSHVPMILGSDGERLSKRHGAVSVMQYADDGYLPDAMVNYLARLGWSHGDAELFSRDQLVQWFDLKHVSRSPAQFDPQKLKWINHEYMKPADPAALAKLLAPRIESRGGKLGSGPDLAKVTALLKDRAETLEALADAAMLFYREPAPDVAQVEKQVMPVKPAIADLANVLRSLGEWTAQSINGAVQEVLKKHALKMPALAIPVRLLVYGVTQTPSLADALAVTGRERVLERLSRS